MAPIVERDLQNLIAMRDEEVLSLITRLLAVRDYPISGVNPGIYANPFLMVRPSEDASDDSPWGPMRCRISRLSVRKSVSWWG